MNVDIKKLTPEMAEDYICFFDRTPHDTFIPEHKCYCVCWASDDYSGKDFSSVDKRRDYAKKYVINQKIQGYLAYSDNQIVGWCNANSRADSLKCAAWQLFMEHVPLDNHDLNVKSVFCFVIDPELKRQGIASKLLERVCDDAFLEGYDFVEAYPYVESGYQSSDFGGYIAMYQKAGFVIYLETIKGPIMRKVLR